MYGSFEVIVPENSCDRISKNQIEKINAEIENKMT